MYLPSSALSLEICTNSGLKIWTIIVGKKNGIENLTLGERSPPSNHEINFSNPTAVKQVYHTYVIPFLAIFQECGRSKVNQDPTHVVKSTTNPESLVQIKQVLHIK